ncbi:MAG: DUF6816 family protein [Coleofasciculaceae cyanobacterium]
MIKLLNIIRVSWQLAVVIVFLLWTSQAEAGPLADRLAQFPTWQSKPPVHLADGDLIYPNWLEGTWQVTSTLVYQVAPLAPEVVTPGFESNRRYLNEPVSFLVRFQKARDSEPTGKKAISGQFIPWVNQNSTVCQGGFCQQFPALTNIFNKSFSTGVVADRTFNGLNIAKAYLGDDLIESVKVDPTSPNRQLTSLRTGRKLISVVVGRATETPNPGEFVATEISNQVFRGTAQPYLNQVETTTDYRLRTSPNLGIEADQVTAIYLSPQDSDYFKALEKPVALYRYRLELLPTDRLSY